MVADLPSRYTLAILGSDTATPEMLAYARKAIARAKVHNWAVLTQDTPTGISTTTIDTCDLNNMLVIIFGITIYPRKRSRQYPRRYLQVPRATKNTSDQEAYEDADRFMMRQANRILILWNGSPADERTLNAYKYAKTLKKPCDFITFIQESPVPQRRTRPSAQPTTKVELLVDMERSRTNASPPAAKYALLAYDDSGNLLSYKQQAFQGNANDAVESVGLQAVISALQQLHMKLRSGTKPSYTLKIYSGSQYLRDWLVYKKLPNPADIAAYVETARQLLDTFPDTEWIKLLNAAVRAKFDKLPQIESPNSISKTET